MDIEHIINKAEEIYPKYIYGFYSKENELKREAYIRGVTDILESSTRVIVWVARDGGKSNSERGLKIHRYIPIRKASHWVTMNSIRIDDSLFPDIKWEDEPVKVKILMIEK